MDGLLGILGLEEEQLRDHQVGDVVVDRAAQEDDALLQQARVDVVGALTARALLDHHRDEGHAVAPGWLGRSSTLNDTAGGAARCSAGRQVARSTGGAKAVPSGARYVFDVSQSEQE